MSTIPPGVPESISSSSGSNLPRGRDRALSLGEPPPPPTLWLPTPVRVARRGNILPILILIALFAVVAAVALPLGFGLFIGAQDRTRFLDQQAIEHFQRALAYESETYNDLAEAELKAALQYEPGYQPALDKLRQLQQAKSAPDQAQSNQLAIANQLFSSAQDAAARQQWSDAIDALEELGRAQPDFQKAQVRSLLLTAYLQAAAESVTEGQIDQAKSRYEAVLQLDPTNAAAQAGRDHALLYFNGTQAVNNDWQNAVLNFQSLYELDPGFYDVKQQLRDAHVGYGEFADNQGAFCIAAREFGAAVALGADAATQTKSALANASCKQAVLSPTPTPTPLPEGILYTGVSRVNEQAECRGIGGVSGTVHDADGNPMEGVLVQIYNDVDYRPPPEPTTKDGTYVLLLGADAGLFHIVLVTAEQTVASQTIDVIYPGGNVTGCHVTVDWTKVQ